MISMKQFEPKEAMAVNEMVKYNNEYVALQKQKIEKEMGIKTINAELKNVKAGIGFPILRAIGTNVFKTIPKSQSKYVIKEMVQQREMVKNQLKGIEGQLLHKHDEYEGAAIKVYRFLYDRFKDEDMAEATSFESPTMKSGDTVLDKDKHA